MAYLKTNYFSEAIVQFVAVTKSDNQYKADAEFYLAMAYLKTKNYAAALPLMQKIHDDKNHVYHERISSKQIREVQLLKWK